MERDLELDAKSAGDVILAKLDNFDLVFEKGTVGLERHFECMRIDCGNIHRTCRVQLVSWVVWVVAVSDKISFKWHV